MANVRPFLALVALLPFLVRAAPAAGAAAPTRSQERAADVPDSEKLSRSTAAVSRMRAVLKEVLGQLEDARNSRDVVKLNCVNEKLTQIKGLLRISEQADVSLQEAVSRHETSAAEHEYTKLTIAREKVANLRSEAEGCIGQLAFRTDENLSVEVEIPKDLPGGDPTSPGAPPPVVVQPPPASPIL